MLIKKKIKTKLRISLEIYSRFADAQRKQKDRAATLRSVSKRKLTSSESNNVKTNVETSNICGTTFCGGSSFKTHKISSASSMS